MTKCDQKTFNFPRANRRVVEANFNWGEITSDGGVLLLRQVDRWLGLSHAVAQCLLDLRSHKKKAMRDPTRGAKVRPKIANHHKNRSLPSKSTPQAVTAASSRDAQTKKPPYPPKNNGY